MSALAYRQQLRISPRLNNRVPAVKQQVIATTLLSRNVLISRIGGEKRLYSRLNWLGLS
jgi:hypothetical protein